MALKISTAARNAAADAIVDLIDAGGPGVLRIYGDTQPATPDTAVTTETLLAEFTLSNPAFGAAATGVATLDVTPALTDVGIATDTATWFRFLTAAEAAGDGQGIVDGTVSATGGGGDLELNTTSISTGVNVEVTGGTITMPGA
jgi:hypothetical protein